MKEELEPITEKQGKRRLEAKQGEVSPTQQTSCPRVCDVNVPDSIDLMYKAVSAALFKMTAMRVRVFSLTSGVAFYTETQHSELHSTSTNNVNWLSTAYAVATCTCGRYCRQVHTYEIPHQIADRSTPHLHSLIEHCPGHSTRHSETYSCWNQRNEVCLATPTDPQCLWH